MNLQSEGLDVAECDAPSAPTELTDTQLQAVAGGLNPQPLPPRFSFQLASLMMARFSLI